MSEDEQNLLLRMQKKALALLEQPLMLLNSGNAAAARSELIERKIINYGPEDFAFFLFRVKGVDKEVVGKYLSVHEQFRDRVRVCFFA